MQTVLLDDVTEEVRLRCDLPTYSTDSPVTTTEAQSLARRSLERLGALLTEAYGEGYLSQSAVLTTTPGFSLVSLPADFETVLRVAWSINSSQPEVPLAIANVDEWVAYPGAWGSYNGWTWGVAPQYRLSANTIEFFPTPDAAYTINLRYTGPMVFSGSPESVQLRSGWFDWLVCDVCVRVRGRQQKEAGDFISERSDLESKIASQAKRDNYSPRQIRNQRGIIPALCNRRRW